MRSFRVFGDARRAGVSVVNRQPRRLASSGEEDPGDSGRSDGAIKEGGGKIAEVGTARENVYFRKVDAELVKKLKDRRRKEISERKEEIRLHQKAIEDAQRELEELDKKVEPSD